MPSPAIAHAPSFSSIPSELTTKEIVGNTKKAISAVLFAGTIAAIALGTSVSWLPAVGGVFWLARTVAVASSVTLSSKWLLERIAESVPAESSLHRYAESEKLQWCVSVLVWSLVGAALPCLEFGIVDSVRHEIAPISPIPSVEPVHIPSMPELSVIPEVAPAMAIPALPLGTCAGFSAVAAASSVGIVQEIRRIRSEVVSPVIPPSIRTDFDRSGSPSPQPNTTHFDHFAVRSTRDAVFVGRHGWLESDSEWSETGGWHSYVLPTPNGEYVAVLESLPETGNYRARLIRYDGKARAFDRTVDLSSEEASDAKKTFDRMEGLFDRSLSERDTEAIAKFRKIRWIAISTESLPSIYAHVTEPDTVQRGVETVFYWFQDLYSIRDGVLPYAGARFPSKSEMRQSVASNSVSAAFLRNGLLESLSQTYTPYEMSRIVHAMSSVPGYPAKVGLPGAALFLNGHTHPGNLHAPSMMDLNDPDALAGIFDRYPALDSYAYCIISEWLPRPDESNAIPLDWGDFGWSRSYAMRFWKIERKASGRYGPEDIVPLAAALS